MKQKLKTILKVTIILVVGIWILSKIPFNQKINQEISVNIYKNGIAIEETTVMINGEKSNYLFNDEDRFNGKFHILSYEKTGEENIFAYIRWGDEQNIQRILYFQNGIHPSMDLIGTMIINEKMTQFALMFTDGTVIATSDEIYQLYTEHVFYDNNSGSTSVTGNIPKF